MQNSNRVLVSFLNELKPEKKIIIVAIIISLLSSMFSIAQPKIASNIIDGINKFISSYLWAALVISLILSAAASAIQQLLLERASERLVLHIRSKIISHCLRLKMSILDHATTPSIVLTLSSDSSMLRNILSQGIVDLISQIFIVVTALIMMVSIDPFLFIVCVVLVLALLIVGICLGAKTRPAAEQLQHDVAKMSNAFDCSLRAIHTIRAYCVTNIFTQK